MASVEAVFQKYGSPSESQRLCDELAPLLGNRSPVPVKCTKKFYNCFISTFDDALAKPNGFEIVCVLLNTLRYISNGSPALNHGFMKFVAFGLFEKNQPGWSKAADEILFTLTVIMAHSSEIKQKLVPMLPTLLMYTSQKNLPCSAKIEASRGCNTLLEECSIEHRCKLTSQPQIKKLIQEMGNLIVYAGDIELQVTMVECLFRLTSVRERSLLAQKWFSESPSVLKAFSRLRDSEFEVDCRGFLNLLNASIGKNRTVYSLPCKRALLGTFELHRPPDPGIDQFWVDFNIASQTLAMFVKDPYIAPSKSPEDSMWEYVIIRKDALKHWTIGDIGSDLCLKLELVDLVHSILPNLSDASHTILITFGQNTNPRHPCELVFGPPVQVQSRTQSDSKQSKAITPVHLTERRQTHKPSAAPNSAMKSTQRVAARQQSNSGQEISPIDVPPGTPATGGQMNSQESDATPDQSALPSATPATSTPKPRSLRPTTTPNHANTPSSTSSRGIMRPTLMFSSSGEPQSVSRKASLAVNTVVLGSKSRVVATARSTPLKTVTGANKSQPEGNGGKGNDTRQAAREEPKTTVSSKVTAKGRPAKLKSAESADMKTEVCSRSEEQNNGMQILNTKKSISQMKQPSKLSMKRTQNQQQSVAQKSAPQAPKSSAVTEPIPSSSSHREMTSWVSTEPKKSSSNLRSKSRTATEPTAVSRSASTTVAHSNHKKPTCTMKEGVHQIPDSPDPYGISSPVDYNIPVKDPQEKLTTVKKSNSCKSNNTTSRRTLGDITNQSASSGVGVTQLNRGGQSRVFNLSAAPLKSSRKSRGSTGKHSVASSLNSSTCSDPELNAIPDSMPFAVDNSKSTPYQSFLDDEFEYKPPPPPSKPRKRIKVPIDQDSFTFDCANESDLSWTLTSDVKKGKGAIVTAGKVPAKRQYKSTHTKEKPKTKSLLTSARTKKAVTAKKKSATVDRKVEQSFKATTRSMKAVTKSSQKQPTTPNEDEVVENVPKKTRPVTTSTIGKKRVIDDIYDPDPDYTPEICCSKQVTAVNAKKPPLKKRATSAVEESSKETPSLPSQRKDTAARKLIMDEKCPKPSCTKNKMAALQGDGKKNQINTATDSNKKQTVRVETSSAANDELYSSPAIPRVSASKPDRADRAQSRMHIKPKRVHSPKFSLHDEDISLVFPPSPEKVCPPSPKKPQLKQNRRSSGYCSNSPVNVPFSPSNSDHSLQAELEDNVQINLQFTDEELEQSPASSTHYPPSKSSAVQNVSLPPSPTSLTSLHSSQIEADLNITAGFEQICREFIARSGKKNQQTTTAKKQLGVKRIKQSETNAPSAKKKRREQENHWKEEEGVEEIDSPSPPPPVVKSRSRKQSRRKSLVPTTVQKAIQPRKTLPINEPTPVSEEESAAEETESSSDNDEQNDSESDNEVTRKLGTNRKTIPKTKQTTHEATDFSSEMQALISSFKTGLDEVANSKKVNTQKLASKATRGELLKLWVAHQKQRTGMSALFQQQLCQELEALEREVKSTQGSEERVSDHLKTSFRTMTKSLHKQQNHVDRLRALQVTYQEHVEQLQKDQEKQRVTAQRSLKKEMHSLQKRLLEDSQKQEVARIKKTLHTMLMQL